MSKKRFQKPARRIAQENIKCEKTKGILFFNSIIVHLPKFTWDDNVIWIVLFFKILTFLIKFHSIPISSLYIILNVILYFEILFVYFCEIKVSNKFLKFTLMSIKQYKFMIKKNI